MNITICDVAKTAHVSPSTVSRALNRPNMVDPATRELICSVANSLGYKPNRVAQALATRRTSNIAVIVSDFAYLGSPDLIKGAQQAGSDYGLTTFLLYGGDDVATELGVIDNIISQVDGIILWGSHLTDAQIVGIQRSIPLVVVNRSVPGISSVTIDHDNGMRCAVEYLQGLQHQRICYLGGSPHHPVHQAVSSACIHAGLNLVAIHTAETTFTAGAEAAGPVLAANATAVICHNDAIAAGLINGLAAHGITVPDRISVIGYGDNPLAQMISPALTTVSVPLRRAGGAALTQLHKLTAATDCADVLPLPTRLVIRQSTDAATAL